MDNDLSASASDPATPSAADVFFGERWAVILAAALLIALGLLTGVRWLTGLSAGSQREEIVQVPVPADASSVSPAKELTAPDPGDNP